MQSFAEHENSNFKVSSSYLEKILAFHTEDNLLKGVPRAQIEHGDIRYTLPKFLKKNSGIRISLLYIDVNLYNPTKLALELLYDYVTPGGVIAFNGYGNALHGGESIAVDEFLSQRALKITMKKFSWTPQPSMYFLKI